VPAPHSPDMGGKQKNKRRKYDFMRKLALDADSRARRRAELSSRAIHPPNDIAGALQHTGAIAAADVPPQPPSGTLYPRSSRQTAKNASPRRVKPPAKSAAEPGGI
jgi:hypothetical protein